MNDQNGRHELKHYINRADLVQLRSRLSKVMSIDRNADLDGGYRVYSMYFDNHNDKALREKIDGVDEREKFRLRFYNDDPSFIRLEKKSKKHGLCYKRTTAISLDTCYELLQGNYQKLKDSNNDLQMELYAKMYYQQLRPKNIVDYRREAFIYRAGNVRVTLDYDIRTSQNTVTFLEPNNKNIPIPEVFILEVKYDHFIPELIKGITTLSSRQETAFSKYAATRII